MMRIIFYRLTVSHWDYSLIILYLSEICLVNSDRHCYCCRILIIIFIITIQKKIAGIRNNEFQS